MQIRRIDTGDRRDVQQFVSFPFQLYRDCPQWVPPLISGEQDALNPQKHPFYKHSVADFFVAESDGQTVGRIAVMDNHNFNQCREAKEAFFGFFDAVEDVAVARALFDVAFEWAHARGLAKIVGPRGLSSIDSGGVLVEGFEHRPALNVPYNYLYYDALITDSGFEKDADNLSGYFRGDHPMPERFLSIAEKVKARRGFTVKGFSSKRELRQWVPRIVEVHREAFSESDTFCAPTEAEAGQFVDTLIAIADPRLIKVGMKGEQVAGFILAYPDVSAALQRARGRLWPSGWFHFLQERRRTRWVNVNGIGVLPEFQGLGPSILLYVEIDRVIKAMGYEHVDVVNVGEENTMSRSAMEVIGIQWYKRHRIYRRAL